MVPRWEIPSSLRFNSTISFGTNPASAGAWGAEQRINRNEALYTYTRWASEYVLKENLLGSIEVGKYADLVVLDIHFPPDSTLGGERERLARDGLVQAQALALRGVAARGRGPGPFPEQAAQGLRRGRGVGVGIRARELREQRSRVRAGNRQPGASISPDGKTIAITAGRESQEIWTLDLR